MRELVIVPFARAVVDSLQLACRAAAAGEAAMTWGTCRVGIGMAGNPVQSQDRPVEGVIALAAAAVITDMKEAIQRNERAG